MNDLELYGRKYEKRTATHLCKSFASSAVIFESTLTVIIIKRIKLVKSQGIKLPDGRIFTLVRQLGSPQGQRVAPITGGR